MNFFEHQAQARAQSRWLFWAFAGALLLTVLGVVALVALPLGLGVGGWQNWQIALLESLPLLLGTGLGVAAVIVLGSLYKIAQLKSGGGAVASSLGGVLVSAETREPRLRRLRNVVEEIAIASGLPVPQIYLLEREAGINAFAAGYTTADAAIAVTRGALEKLSRDELQGVIAHEFSHVRNGDMRINIRLMGLVFGLLLIHLIGREIVARAPRSKKSDGSILALGFGLMAMGGLGLLFGRLIKAGISRQREYLADASAVQFTRQSGGISGALKKIFGMDVGSRLDARKGEEISHMLFGDGVGYSQLFATHPPLVARIQRLEPQFRPELLRSKAAEWNAPDFYTAIDDEAPVAFMAADSHVVTPAGVVAQIAQPGADDYRYAGMLHATLPLTLRAAAQSDTDAPALLMALLMDGEESVATLQRAAITAARGTAETARVIALHRGTQGTENLHVAQRLPLALLAFPALRARPASALASFRQLIRTLSQADGRIGAFEFVLARLLSVQLADWLAPAEAVAGTRRLALLQDDVSLLLGVLADAGSPSRAVALRAYRAGWAHLWPQSVREPTIPADWQGALDVALDRLDQVQAIGKQMLIEALVLTLSSDGRITVGEAELLRVVTASLHCPLPPTLATAVEAAP